MKESTWISCQIGAREHYAIPRALENTGQLKLLITDYWANNDTGRSNPITRNLQGRRHEEIPNNKVISFNNSCLGFEFINKMKGTAGWDMVMKRNQWFQKKSRTYLEKVTVTPTHVFSYSYAALDIFKYARTKNWKTVLGQIDPGPLEEEIVLDELKAFPQYQSEWQPAPHAYWENWREECELADTIIVNSEWSYKALLQKDISKNKIKIVPLNYSSPNEALLFQRNYPMEFNKDRPLRLLFLGQVILRKGIARVIEAARLLTNKPVEFIIAGPIGIHPLPQLPNVKWMGRVPRLEVNEFFKQADIFLFPTLSDGFGLTQLEARAWKLPVITTPFCGEVVRHEVDGFIMQQGKPTEIEQIVQQILTNPALLSRWSSNIINQENEINVSKFIE